MMYANLLDRCGVMLRNLLAKGKLSRSVRCKTPIDADKAHQTNIFNLSDILEASKPSPELTACNNTLAKG